MGAICEKFREIYGYVCLNLAWVQYVKNLEKFMAMSV